METARLFSFELLEQEKAPKFNPNQLELTKHGAKITIQLQPDYFCVTSEGQDPILFDNAFLVVYYKPDREEWDFSNNYVKLNFKFNIGPWRVVGIDDPATDDQTVILDQNQEFTIGDEIFEPLLIIGKTGDNNDALALFIPNEEDIDGIAATFSQRSKPTILFSRREGVSDKDIIKKEEKSPELLSQITQIGFSGPAGKTLQIISQRKKKKEPDAYDLMYDPQEAKKAQKNPPTGSIWLSEPREGEVFPKNRRHTAI